MKFLYRVFFWILPGLLKGLAIFSLKIRHFLLGRENAVSLLRQFRSENPGKIVWFHVASLGEYEQARPVIGKWKDEHPDHLVAVSFFSPSGYDNVIKKPQSHVDYVCYMPLDRKSWAAEFVQTMNPELAFFVKYDLWYFHIQALKGRNIPVYLISASFRENQIYFQWFGGFFRKIIHQLDWIFTQNEASIDLAKSIGYTRVSKAGDTRFDRVAATAASPKELPRIAEWIEGRSTVVVGSAWQEDMNLLIPLINSSPNYRWIIAPHDLNPEPMERWAQTITLQCRKYSSWQSNDSNEVLFIDNIGMLSSLYQFARLAYVGGAFGKGLHNILEPMGFGIPVIFGKVKRVGKFPEAAASEEVGCGFSVLDAQELRAVFEELQNDEFYQRSADSARNWVKSNLGAANSIVSFIGSLSQNK